MPVKNNIAPRAITGRTSSVVTPAKPVSTSTPRRQTPAKVVPLAAIEDGYLVIRVPVDVNKKTESSTGRSYILASTGGKFQDTDVMIDGKPLGVSFAAVYKK